MKYKYQSRIRYSECDEERKLSIAGLVNYFQDTCTFQGEDLHVGMDVVREKGGVWMITYWQIDIDQMPVSGEYISCATWPYSFKGFLGLRNFTMENEHHEIMAKANSVWVLMDAKEGRPVKVYDELLAAYDIEEKLEMEYTPRKIRIISDPASVTISEEPFVVDRHYLDANHHVNNGQYIVMAQGYLPEDFTVGRLRVEYRMQALPGEKICPQVIKTPQTVQVLLNHENGKPYAVVEFARKD